MSKSHEILKETEVTIGRPQVIDNEYLRNLPHNIDPNTSDRKTANLKESIPVEPLEPGALPGAELGRVKKDTELAEMAQEDLYILESWKVRFWMPLVYDPNTRTD